MRTSHALLRLCHDPQFDFCLTSVEYLDRCALGDRSFVQGDKILCLEHGRMEIESDLMNKFIPFHRIRRIIYDGRTMWEKNEGP
jgi:uncharacterized protein